MDAADGIGRDRIAPPGSAPVFVAIEGCNGVGKSTAAVHLARALDATSFHFPPEFIEFKDRSDLDVRVPALPRFAYYLAAVLELSDMVRKGLEAGHVVCDRYFPSSMASSVAFDHLSEGDLRALADPFLSYIEPPDLIVFLTAEPEVAFDRIRRRVAETGKTTSLGERLVSDPNAYLDSETVLRNQAIRLAPVLEVDTTSLSEDEVGTLAAASVHELIASRR